MRLRPKESSLPVGRRHPAARPFVKQVSPPQSPKRGHVAQLRVDVRHCLSGQPWMAADPTTLLVSTVQ